MSEHALDQDFLEHLGATLGEEPEAVLALLGDWLVSYRPERPHELNFLPSSAPNGDPAQHAA